MSWPEYRPHETRTEPPIGPPWLPCLPPRCPDCETTDLLDGATGEVIRCVITEPCADCDTDPADLEGDDQ